MTVEAQPMLGGGPLVDVLLATYNGARYIEAQLESLAAQTYPNIRILVSDDGSSDATVSVVQAFAQRMTAGWIQWVSNPHPGRGVARNFEALMAASAKDGSARWIAFCDQDDVWLPHKVERFVQAMTELECDASMPCLVHSDLRVVDESLHTVAASFIRQQRINVSSMTLPVLLGVNHVTGCATMVNQALLNLALPLPPRVVMHDWWCALLSCQGRRHFLTDPLVLYRQHGGNQVGARSREIGDRILRIVCDGPRTMARIRWLGLETLDQAQALQERLLERGLNDLQVRDYLHWRRLSVWRRLGGYGKYYKGPMLDNFCRLFLW
ncbi:glycosyltransferase family 2 protein [Acidovorax sp. NB1]|uniref:glycosyltransferase family 2 protein n=1 Tax=Acidovorax sp. NB1 TaxID=1943571 RepID=UPI0010F7B7BB|nr:glycosyltransferase family 2 protein [Acidovorax sp. NB1]